MNDWEPTENYFPTLEQALDLVESCSVYMDDGDCSYIVNEDKIEVVKQLINNLYSELGWDNC